MRVMSTPVATSMKPFIPPPHLARKKTITKKNKKNLQKSLDKSNRLWYNKAKFERC
jgi:hypothetical protein